MEAQGVNKPFLIFAAVLFTAIVSGTVVTERILKAQEQSKVKKNPIIVNSPAPTVFIVPSPAVTQMPTATILPLKKPIINIREREDELEKEDD